MIKNYINKIVFSISLGVWLLWISLFFSYKKLGNDSIVVATGGFPFKALDYPCCYAGSDWPPSESWPLFFANFGIWLIVGFIISLFIDSSKLNNRNLFGFFLSAISVSVVGLAYLALMYD
jgi:hypothetical protein